MIVVFVCLSGLGILLIIQGILGRLGYYRLIYTQTKGLPVFMPPLFGFVSIPIGIGMAILGSLTVLPLEKSMKGDLVLYVLLPLLIITYVLAIWRPQWIKPVWLQWLEREHGDILHLLWEDVRKDGWEWERRVRTQQDLEEWVKEVRCKHGLM